MVLDSNFTAVTSLPGSQGALSVVTRREIVASALRPRTSGLFVGMAAWPDIDAVFACRALRILSVSGIGRWLGAGGQVRRDGRLGFGPVSSVAIEVLEELAATSAGFLWTDDTGTTWVLRIMPHQDRVLGTTAYAVTYHGNARLLDSRVRRLLGDRLAARAFDLPGRGRSWTGRDRTEHLYLTQAGYTLQLLDRVEDLLPRLRHAVEADDDTVVVLATPRHPTTARSRPAWPGNPSDDLPAVLQTAMALQLAEIRLGPIGWAPRFVDQSPAITEMQSLDDNTFRVRVSPLVARVVDAFSQRTTKAPPTTSSFGFNSYLYPGSDPILRKDTQS